MMRRHLIALFALFTGLAAIHAPASASTLETMVFDARAFSSANEGGADKACICPAKDEVRKNRCIAPDRKPMPARLRGAVRPAIIFGSERALE
ncbi:MAG: hypothetical protein WA936_09480 [Erythrobacter sp.]